MKTYNEVVDDLESLEKKEATDVSGLDTRVSALEEIVGTTIELYEHNLTLTVNISDIKSTIYTKIINENSTALTSIIDILYNNYNNKRLMASGYLINTDNNKYLNVLAIYTNNSYSNISIEGIETTISSSSSLQTQLLGYGNVTITDNVIKLV